ncbi:unnamed protein product [Moneuplotes crassus]|uniref:Uncharacterized protein n=1 Tax=Euplotes crassus TaxID=5936 RepID=A0AAD1U038_EUPCR|nr:unnamed protein product [Moneuplotes crassus]
MNVLFTDRQRILSKFSRLRSVNNESCVTETKLDFVMPYISKNFDQKLSKYQDGTDELIENIKENKLTELDKNLIKQIDPSWESKMENTPLNTLCRKDQGPGDSAQKKRNITSPEYKVSVSAKDVHIELQQRPPSKNYNVSSSSSFMNEEDMISAEVDDGGIAFGNKESILSKKEEKRSASYLAKINEDKNEENN